MDYASPLRGMGHFTIWFLIGLVVFFAVRAFCNSRSRFHQYGPFLPMVLGTYAVLPYAFIRLGLVSMDQAYTWPFMVFLFYPVIDRLQFAHALFGNFHWDVLMLAAGYALLCLHYIAAIKKASRRTNTGQQRGRIA
jgi:hypothetical protein